MNNREYNVLKNFMRSQVDYNSAKTNRFIAMDQVHPAIDYVALANSMGVPACRVERASDIAPSVDAAISSGATNLVEVLICTS
jgi:benzoylformate decarboxylase